MKRVTLDVWQKASILSELKETAVSSIFASKQNAFILFNKPEQAIEIHTNPKK